MNNFIVRIAAVLTIIVGAAPLARAQHISEPPQLGVSDFRKPINPDPIIQHAKEVYILNGCHFCHGIRGRVPNGDHPDLVDSKLVAADTGGDVIVELLNSGMPPSKQLSPMPQFSYLSEANKRAVAVYIHYARMEEHYKDLMARPLPAGDASAGQTYFNGKCATCHTPAEAGALAKKAGSDGAILKPAFLTAITSFSDALKADAKYQKARSDHQRLIENYSARDAANLLAYLKFIQ